MRILWSILVLLFATRCQEECTEIGCGDVGLRIVLKASTGTFDDGPYSIALTADDVAYRSECELAADQNNTCLFETDGEGSFVVKFSGTDLHVFKRAGGDFLGAEVVSVTIEHGGVLVVEQDYRPEYQRKFPNGPECNVCESAAIETLEI